MNEAAENFEMMESIQDKVRRVIIKSQFDTNECYFLEVLNKTCKNNFGEY